MKIRSAALDVVCGPKSALPETGQPEIAFIGRSNVGKSSLINALLNRKQLARTSSQPGKTQTINFYHVNGEMYLVDLPGYGYASASKEARAAWAKMIGRYFRTSKELRAVFLLVDIRHDPTAGDLEMYRRILEGGRRPVVVATKTDKISRNQLQKQLKAVRTGLQMEKDGTILPFSAHTKAGRDEIWEYINGLLAEDEAGDAGEGAAGTVARPAGSGTEARENE